MFFILKCDISKTNNIIFFAGWSSLEARRAHNPKVIGSNPIPAICLYIKNILCIWNI